MMIPNTPTTRLVTGTSLLAAILLATATRFDATELWAIAVWASAWSLAELLWMMRDSEERRGTARCTVVLLLVPLALPFVPTPKYRGEVTREPGETNAALILRAQKQEALDRSWR